MNQYFKEREGCQLSKRLEQTTTTKNKTKQNLTTTRDFRGLPT